MGPVPQLSTYQQAAQSIYEPQKAAEATALGATRDTTKNTLESEKGQISTDYESALQSLKDSVTQQSGQISQLYTSRLLGNISGLQGNDMGQMFSKANQQQAIISETRANKLNSITTAEGNADINYNAGIASLTPKYQSMEEQYAQSGYGSAVKDYNTQAYQQEQLQMRQEALDETARHNSATEYDSAANRAQSAANSDASKYSVKQQSGGNYLFKGPNGQPVSMAQYLEGASQGDGKVWTRTALNVLQNGTAYDKAIYQKAIQAFNNHGDVASTIAKYDTKNAYGLRG